MNRSDRRYRSLSHLTSLCALMAVASCSSGTPSTSLPATVVPAASTRVADNIEALRLRHAAQTPLLPPAGTIYLGAYVNPANSLGPFETQTFTFEQNIGRKLAIHSEYYSWADSFPNAQEVDDYKYGRVPLISWNCGDTNYNVSIGKQDAVINNAAQNFKAYGHHVFLRFFWEMNLPLTSTYQPVRTQCHDSVRDKNDVFNPADYIAAWNHIRAIFAAQGVKNVVWVWNISGSLDNNPAGYYPGASEVDWVGFDHYDTTGNAGLQSTLAAPYAALQQIAPGTPQIVGETATIASGQPTYVGNMPTVLQSDFPGILAFMYYDAPGGRGDWSLSSAGIAAFKTAGASPYLSAMVKHNIKTH